MSEPMNRKVKNGLTDESGVKQKETLVERFCQFRIGSVDEMIFQTTSPTETHFYEL